MKRTKPTNKIKTIKFRNGQSQSEPYVIGNMVYMPQKCNKI